MLKVKTNTAEKVKTRSNAPNSTELMQRKLCLFGPGLLDSSLLNHSPIFEPPNSKGKLSEVNDKPPVKAEKTDTTSLKEEAPKELPLKEELAEKDGPISGPAPGVLLEIGAKTPATPEEDPAFQQITASIVTSSKVQQKHKSPKTEGEKVQRAALLPASQQRSEQDQQQHLKAIDKAATKSETDQQIFKPETFKKKFRESVAKVKLPTSEEEAEEFKKGNALDELKNKFTKDVADENKRVAGPLSEQVGKAAPESSLPVMEPEALKSEKVGKRPAAIDPAKAVPKPKRDSEITMEAEGKKLDAAMDQYNLTEEQLEKSGEPSFKKALDHKRKAQREIKKVPERYRKEERAILAEAAGQAKASSEKQFTGMHQGRAKTFSKVFSQQKQAKSKQLQKKEEITKKLTKIYDDTKAEVQVILEVLLEVAHTMFADEVEVAQKIFEGQVNRRLEEISSWTDFIFGEDEAGAALVFREEKHRFITALDDKIDLISKFTAARLNMAIARIRKGKIDAENYITSLSKEERLLAADTISVIRSRFDDLEDEVRQSEEDLIKGLAQTYKESEHSRQEVFDSIKTEVNKTWIDQGVEFVTGVGKAVYRLGQLLYSTFKRMAMYINYILQDPKTFFENISKGIKEGFKKFSDNIGNYLISSFFDWLRGKMSKEPIKMPDKMDASGLFSLAAQVIGINYAFFRNIAKRKFGPKVVEKLEMGVEFAGKGFGFAKKIFGLFSIAREKGLGGLWEHVKEMITSRMDDIFVKVRDIVMFETIKKGLIWIATLFNPLGALLKIVQLVYTAASWLKDNIDRIETLVNAFVDSVYLALLGKTTAISAKVVLAARSFVVMAIDFLAKLLRLGSLAKKIRNVLKALRKPFVKAFEWLLNKMKPLIRKLRSMFRKSDRLIARGKKKIQKGKERVKKKVADKGKKKDKKKRAVLKDTEVGEHLKFKAGGESHALWINTKGKVKVMVASNPLTVSQKIAEWRNKLNENSFKGDKKETIALLDTVEKDYLFTLKKAVVANKEMGEAKKDKSPTSIKEAKLADDIVEKAEKKVMKNLDKLFDVFGETNVFTIPPKIRKYLKKDVLSKDKTEFIGKFITALQGTDYTTVVANKDNKEKPTSFMIRRSSEAVKKNAPKLYVNNIGDKKGVLDVGHEKEYVPEHKNYVPTNLTITQSEGEYTATYDTKTYDGKPGPDLEVKLSFAEILKGIPNKVQKRTVKGKKLRFKPEGQPRGKTDSAVEGFHNAHLIGDRFGGSGLNQALNIYPSSPEYNVSRSYMLGVEDEIAAFLSKQEKLYTMEVTAHIDEEINNQKNLQALLEKEFAKDTSSDEDAKLLGGKLVDDAEQKLTKALRAEIQKDIKDVPGQFLKLQYMVDGKNKAGLEEDPGYDELVKKLGYTKVAEGDKVVYRKG